MRFLANAILVMSTVTVVDACHAESRLSAGVVMAQLREAVERRDSAKVGELKRRWEEGWDKKWSLVEISFEDIGWFQRRIALKWERPSESETRIRQDSFTLDGAFASALESVAKGGRTIAAAEVSITQDGRIRARNWSYFGTKVRQGLPASFPPMPEVLYHELEIVEGGRVVSAYRSKLNFHVNVDTAEPEDAPSDATLVSGVRWPAVERLIAAQRAESAKQKEKQ